MKEETTMIEYDIHDPDEPSIFQTLEELINYVASQENGTVGEYKFIINFLPQQRQYSPFSYRPLSAPE